MYELTAEDRAVVERARAEGVAYVPDLLSAEELAAARRDFDAALRTGPGGEGSSVDEHELYYQKVEENGATRTGLAGDHLGALPGLFRLWAHPRIVAIIGGIMGEPEPPFMHEMRMNRYLPPPGSSGAPHPGVRAHSDSSHEVHAMAWEKVCSMIFLDDIDERSGALEYKPTTHLRHFLNDDGTRPPSALPQAQDVSAAHEAGEFLPIALPAGGVVFRVPAVWHAVRPIYRLRRYATARYCLRSKRPVATEGWRMIRDIVERRRAEAAELGGAAVWQKLEEPLRSLCAPDVYVTPLAGSARM